MKNEIILTYQKYDRTFYMNVGPDGITLDAGMKLSAYRVLAKEMGFNIGLFTFTKGPNTVSAKITRI